VLNELEKLVTADTLLRWYRELIASKWNYSHRRGPGRPRVMTVIADLIVQRAIDNPSCGIHENPRRASLATFRRKNDAAFRGDLGGAAGGFLHART
jgi:hypothetical protein